MGEQLYLNEGLLIKLGFIAYNFEGEGLIFLMIIDFNDLTITALSHFLQNLIPISNMVMEFINILVP